MGETSVRTWIAALAAGCVAAACTTVSRDVNDGGRAQRLVEEAPVDAPVEDVLAEATIVVADQAVDFRRVVEGPIADEDDPNGGLADSCDADKWEGLVGTDIAGVDQRLLPKPHRVIGPDDFVTQDFVTNRLNIHIDDEAIITKVVCG